jgi:MFS transporter, DHA2 family, multidrug resistance protein
MGLLHQRSVLFVGILMVSAFVHDPPYLKRGVAAIDWGGIMLLTVGLTAAQVVLERGEEVDWFASHWIVFGTVVAALALTGWWWGKFLHR